MCVDILLFPVVESSSSAFKLQTACQPNFTSIINKGLPTLRAWRQHKQCKINHTKFCQSHHGKPFFLQFSNSGNWFMNKWCQSTQNSSTELKHYRSEAPLHKNVSPHTAILGVKCLWLTYVMYALQLARIVLSNCTQCFLLADRDEDKNL